MHSELGLGDPPDLLSRGPNPLMHGPVLDELVRADLEACYRRALGICAAHEPAVRRIATALASKGWLDGHEVRTLLAEAREITA